MRYGLLFSLLASLAVVPLAAGCGDDDGPGTVSVEIWGEEFIEDGIPASELADGWAVTYDHFVVVVGDVAAAGATFPEARAFDLTEPGPVAVTSGEASSGPIAPVSYGLVGADSSTTNVNVHTGVFDDMVTQGWSVYVSGTATRDASSISFAWGFDVQVTFSHCEATDDVPSGGIGSTQLTIHGDHLLYESLVDHDAELRFQALADADADGDNDVTPAELAAFSGVGFQALDNYNVPPDSGIDNLWDYLAAQVATLGHIDGEGHCGE